MDERVRSTRGSARSVGRADATGVAFLAACVLAFAVADARAGEAEASPSLAKASDGALRSLSEGRAPPPTLEEFRDCLLRHGVQPRLVRIEEPASSPAAPAGPAEGDDGRAGSSDLPRRLVFWAKTGDVTQTVIVAVIEGPPGEEEKCYLRIQSAGLARAPDGHARLAEVMAYMLDRNFAMTGAQFARDAADGEVVLRADVPCAQGIADKDFVQAVESVVRAAEDEAPRLAAILAR